MPWWVWFGVALDVMTLLFGFVFVIAEVVLRWQEGDETEQRERFACDARAARLRRYPVAEHEKGPQR